MDQSSGVKAVLPSRHPEKEVVMDEHGDVHIQLRGVNQMQQANHGPAVANHDDGLESRGGKYSLCQGHADGHGR